MFTICSELFPAVNMVQKASSYFVELGTVGLWKYFTYQALTFYAIIGLVLFFVISEDKQSGRGSLIRKLFLSDALFLTLLLVFVVLSRLPLLVIGQVNPDEANWIAISKTLAHDPRYWVSADGGTGGPIVSFILLPLKLFGVGIDFGSIKVVAILMMVFSIIFTYLGLSRIAGRSISRLMILPLTVAIAMMQRGDLIGYNSEHPVILMLSVAFFFLAKVQDRQPGRYNANIIVLGVILGSVPFAKLQGSPMAVTMGLIGCLLVYRSYGFKATGTLALSALLPTLLTVVTVSAYGGLDDMWQRFINYNLNYANTSPVSGTADNMISFVNLIYEMKELAYFFDYSFILILLSLLIVFGLGKVSRREVWFVVFAFLFLFSSVFSINTSGRFFHHYSLLFLFPLTLLFSATINLVMHSIKANAGEEQVPGRFVIVKLAATLILFIAPSFYNFQRSFAFVPGFVETAKTRLAGAIPYPEVIAVLNRYYQPGEKLAIWGWAYELWASTDFLMGTRDAGNAGSKDGEDYYSKCYLKDLEENKPSVFIETVAPGFFVFQDRAIHGFELNSAIKKYIYDHYTFEAEINGARIFLRKDKPIAKKQWVTHGLPKPPDRTEGFSHDFALTKMGTLLQFRGWMIFNSYPDSLKNQRVRCMLFNQSDTILVESYIKRDWAIESYFNNPNFRFAGYEGYIDCQEINPKGDYKVGLYVENNGLSLFVDKQRVITIDDNCQSFK